MSHYDVIVIGGGHAGAEAAYHAAQMGAKVLIVSSSQEAIGGTSCNPAIGGIGKTHIVKEIDVYQGVMPRAADRAAIHYRTLNQKKGKAVQATRVQIDKDLYQSAVQEIVFSHPNIFFIADMVQDLICESGKITGVQTTTQNHHAPAVVITTGTFLGGVIHIGQHKIPAGRFGDTGSSALADFFVRHNFSVGRLKTGTPARLDGRSIDWKNMGLQASEKNPDFVSRGTFSLYNPQIACGITFTNQRTHQIIQENLHLSAVYSGQIAGKGPRYCPSIEDKIFKFPEKDQHQIFVEPETLSGYSVYPNGISTSLPISVQDAYLRSIAGFEKVSVIRYGYAIEYVYIDPKELYHNLETRKIKGLFLAGQINGTTGYEEAAGQGMVAGINAVLSIDHKTHIFPRAASYIGVMIDDLVSQGVDEPYRMFTSRSEFRTLLRTDNAILRMKNVPRGTFSSFLQWDALEKTHKDYVYLKEILEYRFFVLSDSKKTGLPMPADGRKRNFYELLSHPLYKEWIRSILYQEYFFFKDVIDILVIDAEYHTYTDRLVKFQKELNVLQDFSIPLDFDFKTIVGLSAEMSSRLNEKAPRSLHEIKNLAAITPAAFMIVARYFKVH